jgi:cell division protein FtsB
MADLTGSIQAWVPVLGGFGALIWLIWRLFWKVDRRSQQDLAMKDVEITRLTTALEHERDLRHKAEDEASKAKARETALVSSISDLKDQINELRAEVSRLRVELTRQTTAAGGGTTP